jgi:hypothetical protein
MNWLKKLTNPKNAEERLLSKYLAAVKKEFPLWFNSRLNPTHPRDRFPIAVGEIKETFEARRKTANQDAVLQTFEHLLDVWPGGILGYNAWYALHTAEDMGLIDSEWAPIQGGRSVNEQARLRQELRDLGGDEAVAAYERAMNP